MKSKNKLGLTVTGLLGFALFFDEGNKQSKNLQKYALSHYNFTISFNTIPKNKQQRNLVTP